MRLSLPSLLATSILVCGAAVAACSGGIDSSTTSSNGSSALASGSTGDGGAFDPTACLAAYADAVRAAGKPTDDARKALHECLRPPPPPRDADGGPGCGKGGDGDHDGPGHGPPPPDGDHDGGANGPPPGPPPPPPPPDGHGDDGDADDGDGGAPKGGPRACIDALDTCAEGTGDISGCVSTAVACLEALPKPGGHGRGPRDH